MAKSYKIIRHLTSYILLLTSSIFLLNSCQEGGEAGDLFGQWRMADSDSKYVSFSGSLTRFRDKDASEVYGNFQHKGDSLFIQCYSKEALKSDTVMVEESFGFKPFNNIRVKIEALNGDILVLSKEGQKWNFYKY
ncbi:lipocalin-like domain-containing protein [Prevotella sp. tf2-5]|uniref:lipocalin-like domain-containing protein n=1 Tax=Prevotella sp. tf2-5 TaxID=1761889 RepID=UPI0008F3B5A6|nr:lipocalin-like domain-containing protein [Prevotella sp. tf2-5]SFO88440.1 Lipocalin-like domain-containing protein [Prevotella sp. tf2-5]